MKRIKFSSINNSNCVASESNRALHSLPIGVSRLSPRQIPDTSFPPGIEVVTMRTDAGKVMTTIHGGWLDGERFTGTSDAESQHERACRLARMTSWPCRRRR